MARQVNVKEDSPAIREGTSAFAVVEGGKTSLGEMGGADLEFASAAPSSTERVTASEPTQPVSHWPHASFEQALNGLLADIRDRTAPVVILTGEAGTGKTLLVQCVLGQLGEDAIPVLHGHPHSSFQGFLNSVCRQLGLCESQSEAASLSEDRFDLFWNYLRAASAQGRRLVVFVDNAHDMPESLLEELALMSRWPEADKRALQIVLIGLPSLHGVVQKLVQRQLIDEGYPTHWIAPLEPEEVSAFVCLKLSECGEDTAQVVAPEAIDRIAFYSQGIPRVILTLCSLAVLNARLEGRSGITPDLVDQVAQSAMLSGRMQQVDELKVHEDILPAQLVNRRLTSVSHSTHGQEEGQMTRLEDLTKILKSLQNRSPGIEASALISEDGLMIASALSSELDDTRVGGMTATLLSLGTRAAAELHRGEVREVIVRGDNGYAVMVSAGSGTLLLVLTTEETKLGLIFFDMREAIKGISKVLFR